MNINWKLKSLIFRIIDQFRLKKLLYYIQKNITKNAKVEFTSLKEDWLYHRENLKNLKSKKIIEFGAGKSLEQNIYLSNFFDHQTLIDLNHMIDFKLVNIAIKQLNKINNTYSKNVISNFDDLRLNYNIDYMAPVDIASTNLIKNDTFDGCISTNTLEHIPKENLVNILIKLKNIIKNEGLVSAIIDYSDHYSHTDKNLSPLNFLKYNSYEFNYYNHDSHYQNRLRHDDYKDIFQKIGFKVLKSKALNYTKPNINISKEFDANNKNTFATKGIYLLQNSK